MHFGRKGPLNPISYGKHHCLVVIDAFSRDFQLYPVKSTGATHTILAMTTFVTSFGKAQKLVYDRRISFIWVLISDIYSGTRHNLCARSKMVRLDYWECRSTEQTIEQIFPLLYIWSTKQLVQIGFSVCFCSQHVYRLKHGKDTVWSCLSF